MIPRLVLIDGLESWPFFLPNGTRPSAKSVLHLRLAMLGPKRASLSISMALAPLTTSAESVA